LANGLSDHGESLLADFAVRHDVVWIVEVEFVDFFARHERVDVDGALALDRYGFELFRLDFQVFAFADFVPFDDVGALDLVAGISINLAILDPIAGLLVKLVKADLLSLTGRREQSDRARDEGQLEIAFPIGARGHDLLRTLNAAAVNQCGDAAFRI